MNTFFKLLCSRHCSSTPHPSLCTSELGVHLEAEAATTHGNGNLAKLLIGAEWDGLLRIRKWTACYQPVGSGIRELQFWCWGSCYLFVSWVEPTVKCGCVCVYGYITEWPYCMCTTCLISFISKSLSYLNTGISHQQCVNIAYAEFKLWFYLWTVNVVMYFSTHVRPLWRFFCRHVGAVYIQSNF